MSDQSAQSDRPLKILHCLRAVDGGLFRHVRDVAEQQANHGHLVGILCDSRHYSDLEESRLDALTTKLSLGLHRFPIPRGIGWGDIGGIAKTAHTITQTEPDVVHGHGAKGGVMSRLGTQWSTHKSAARLYCPHGGSLWFERSTIKGELYFAAERFQERFSDAIICVSKRSGEIYREKINDTQVPVETVYNGLHPHEFKAIKQSADPADFLMIGALRYLKGIDQFLKALVGLTRQDGSPATGVIVGSGDERDKFITLASELGLADRIKFLPPMPARDAFMLARVNVIASRSESFPYIALESIGAGMPLVSTNVGGIPEIFGHDADMLVQPDNHEALQQAMQIALQQGDNFMRSQAQLRERVKTNFTVEAMSSSLHNVYLRAISRRMGTMGESTEDGTSRLSWDNEAANIQR